MEVITPEESKAELSKEVDEKARKVFNHAIELLGGLKKLIEFRNLTWLPSLAEAAYSVVLKNELMLTNAEIAAKLGISKQTVEAILAAKAEKLEAFLKGQLEKLDEHKAGSLAKLAYKKLKETGFLEASAEISKQQAKEIEKALNVEVAWAVFVLHAIKGIDFPIEDRETLKEKLAGIKIKGKDASSIIDAIEMPVKNPAELLHKIKEKI